MMFLSLGPRPVFRNNLMHCVAAIKAATPPPTPAALGRRRHRLLPAAAATPTPRVPGTVPPAPEDITSPPGPARRRPAVDIRAPQAREATASQATGSNSRPIRDTTRRQVVLRHRGTDRRVIRSLVLGTHSNNNSNNNRLRLRPVLDMHSRMLLICRYELFFVFLCTLYVLFRGYHTAVFISTRISRSSVDYQPEAIAEG